MGILEARRAISILPIRLIFAAAFVFLGRQFGWIGVAVHFVLAAILSVMVWRRWKLREA